MLDSDSDVPSDVEEAAQSALSPLVPKKSKEMYDLAYTYSKFEKWCEAKNVKYVNEKVILAYFERMKTLKASTLSSLYSMLRCELSLKRNIEIKNYTSLMAFLKRLSDGYHAKKSNVFSKENISKFLTEADDKTFLMTKVAMIVGIAGGLRKSELIFLRVEDVFNEQSYYRVNIPNTKTKVIREFVITAGDIEGLNFVKIIKKYMNLRPKNVNHNRFFVKYNNGKCGVQPVGINTFGNLPKKIAECIGLPNCTLFTGHCFKRTSATLLANSGTDILKLKRHCGWKSNTVAEGYVENSIETKKRIATDILGERCVSQISENSTNTSTNSTSLTSGVNLTNCSNCVVNIYNN